MTNYKLGIIGLGFVGNAILQSLLKKNFKLNENLFIYDKFKDGGIGNINDVLKYLQDKKSLWTLTHNVDVYGYPLEPYAQDEDIKYPKNQGVYSLMNNEWIQKPVHCDYDFQSDHLLKQKVQHYMHAIDHMIKHHMGEESFNNMKVRFKNMRTASLQQYGEFGRENLVFKELRNRGYIDKMNKYQASLKDKELSLK